ncbi:mpst-3 [Pristionchus pacificus]|uniref:Uncharacterized protein n=1 Tax=Pristionchus pacificus TaxID=54126 RepID=A0A2A6CHS5_PRIPA|nr:mpst-3 [Pristionchus pacificus]|eukprot:PDM77640.1 hypothetical protein PRIPAC_34507 [Pristionchus pacificus]
MKLFYLLLSMMLVAVAVGEIHKAEGQRKRNALHLGCALYDFDENFSMAPTVSVAQLRELIKTAGSTVRILDATYRERPAMSREAFQADWYGKVEKAQREWMSDAYLKEHLPNAAFFNCEAATYPGQYEKSSLYPADIFAQYVRLLGVNKGDTVVVYARGACSGMLWAARAWWLLKVYGMERVHVLEGGLDRWKAEGGQVVDGPATIQPGNWDSSAPDAKLFVSFDDLFGNPAKVNDTYPTQINLLDARPAGQFNGTEPLSFDPNGAPGFHIPHSLNIPLPTLFTQGGELKSEAELAQILTTAGIVSSKPLVTMCNGGTQASLLGLACVKADKQFRLFNGSLREVSLRAPQLISDK